MEAALLQVERPVIHDVSTLSMHRPHLSLEGGSHNVLVAIAVDVKQEGGGGEGSITEGGRPQRSQPIAAAMEYTEVSAFVHMI